MKKALCIIMMVLLAATASLALGESADQPTLRALFSDTLALETGTAGASLREAALACDWLSYACGKGASSEDGSALAEKARAALSVYTAEAQARIMDRFFGVDALLTGYLENGGDMPGVFADAGVGETVSALAARPEAAACWRAVSEAVREGSGWDAWAGRNPAGLAGEMEDWTGIWQDRVSQRAMLEVTRREDGSYDLFIHWGSSAWESAQWLIHGSYDADEGALFYEDGQFAILTANDAGEITPSEQAACHGVFLREGSMLRWVDSRNPGCVQLFEKTSFE